MENENKMYYKPQYKCGICGNIYENIADRVKCESACLKKQEEDAKKAAEAKKLEEKGARYAQIIKLNKELNEKIQSYLNDYGSIHIDDNYYFNENNLNGLYKLLGW